MTVSHLLVLWRWRSALGKSAKIDCCRLCLNYIILMLTWSHLFRAKLITPTCIWIYNHTNCVLSRELGPKSNRFLI